MMMPWISDFATSVFLFGSLYLESIRWYLFDSFGVSIFVVNLMRCAFQHERFGQVKYIARGSILRREAKFEQLNFACV